MKIDVLGGRAAEGREKSLLKKMQVVGSRATEVIPAPYVNSWL